MLSNSRLVAAAALLLLAAGVSSAQGVKLEFVDGRVNLSAQGVPARVILAEWARLGGTTIVGGDRIAGGPVSLELMGVTEREALDVLLREVPGYMLAARQQPVAGRSRFDRIMVVPTTATPPRPPAAPAFTSAPPPAFGNGNDDGPADDTARLREEAVRAQDALRRAQEATRVVNPAVTAQPGAPPPFETSPPRPAAPPPPVPGNPFMPTPGSSTPGTIAPVPQPQPQNQPRPVQ